MTETPAQLDQAALAPWCLFAAEALRSTDVAALRAWLVDLGDEALLNALGSDSQALEVEYVRLFLHPNGAACPPWQDVYGIEPAIMGEAHHRALDWYRLLGVAPPLETEPADHAGLLLGFYGLILNGEEHRHRAPAFAQEHLAWLDKFGERLSTNARHPFYTAMGELVLRLRNAIVE